MMGNFMRGVIPALIIIGAGIGVIATLVIGGLVWFFSGHLSINWR